MEGTEMHMYAHAMSEQQWAVAHNHYSPSLKGNHAAARLLHAVALSFSSPRRIASPLGRALIPSSLSPQPPSSLSPARRSIGKNMLCSALVDAFLLAIALCGCVNRCMHACLPSFLFLAIFPLFPCYFFGGCSSFRLSVLPQMARAAVN